MNIAVVTDTGAGIPPHLAEKHGIIQVRLKVTHQKETYEDGALTAEEIIAMQENSPEPPGTSAPSVGDFVTAFGLAFDFGYDRIVCPTISSKESGTFNFANAAAYTLNEGRDRDRIAVIDTKSASMGAGIPVLKAAIAAQAEKSFEEVIAVTQAAIERTQFHFALHTFQYAVLKGRLSQAELGAYEELRDLGMRLKKNPRLLKIGKSLFDKCVKVVGTINEDGKPQLTGVVPQILSSQRRIKALFDKVRRALNLEIDCLSVVYTDQAQPLAEKLIARLSTIYPVDKIIVAEASTALLVLAGKKGLAVAFSTKKRKGEA